MPVALRFSSRIWRTSELKMKCKKDAEEQIIDVCSTRESMLCPDCERENDPDYRFCIFCGSRLRTSATHQHSNIQTELIPYGTHKARLNIVINIYIRNPGRRKRI